MLRECKNVTGFSGIDFIGFALEDQGGSGSAGVHLEEGNEGDISFDSRSLTVNGIDYVSPGIDQELMSAFAETADISLPLSKITIAMLDDLGWVVDYDKADIYHGPITMSIPQSLTFNVERGNTTNITLTFDNTINGTSQLFTDKPISYYTYGGIYYNVLGSMTYENGDNLDIDQGIPSNNSDLILQYTPPTDTNVNNETFYYTVYYVSNTNQIIQSNNCFVTINITD
jgi:hypothetical protein